jgi:iron complex transport system substrate-binding protein
MRHLPAPPSNRSEGSIRVRLLALLVTAILAAACTSSGAGFTAGPQPTPASAAPTAAASSAAPTAASVAPSTSASASAPGSAAPSASTAPSAPATASAAPSASTQPSIAPPSVTAAPVSYPLTLTDDENNQVTLKAEPKKIVSITPATTEILFSLGVGDRLIANTDADDYPPQVKDLPHVATFNSVDVEKIVGMGADLVIAGGNGFNKPDSLAQLRRLGIPVLVVYAPNVDGVYHDFQLIAQAVNRVDAGNGLVASVRSEFQSVAAKTSALAKPRTFYELDATKEIYGPADDSFIVEMIALAGGAPITTGSPTVYSIPLEKLVAADPEVIVLGDAAYGTTADIVKGRAGWATMTAVKTGAIRPIDDIIVTRPGPRLAEGLKALALAIHPDLVFAEPSAIPSASAGASAVPSLVPSASY